ncbi:MAG: beta-N-acetylhexosaminidase [Clostridia bacterium]|nr:beta-N-acetylhexosaminidase [Clostridia bacterium]
MRLKFINAENLLDGISVVADDLGFEISETAEVTVTVETSDEEISSLKLDDKRATITYGKGKSRFFRALAILVKAIKDGDKSKCVVEHPVFTTNGAMIDMSRNAVMKVNWVEAMMRKMALMGLNTFMLYTEDTYEIEGRPYFGYMRGRYTKDELKHLDAYAIKLGIELIPCIQTLGHLATHLIWAASNPYKDSANCLLIGAEETYKLIEDMFKTCKECFTTNKIHIGMDEARDYGTGRYLTLYGYRDHVELFHEHLNKVVDMAHSYGFEPMMWSDMFFRQAANGKIPAYSDYDKRVVFEEGFKDKMPKGLTQVFWDYYKSEQDFYEIGIDKHRKYLSDKTVFAGGIWLWSGHTPLYSRSLKNSIPALRACLKKGVDSVIATAWLNGGDGSLILSLPGIAWYADFDYKGGFDLDSAKECFERACGVSYDSIVCCEELEYPDNSEFPISRSFLYNDPMQGLCDANMEGFDPKPFLKEKSKKLNAQTNLGIFEYAFDVTRRLCSLLENKADFGVRLKKAYENGDRETMKALADECDVIRKKAEAFRLAHRRAWMEYCKPFGWEVYDIKYGGVINRIDTAKMRILDYLEGRVDRLEELEAERLRIDNLPNGSFPRFNGDFIWRTYKSASTPNIL